MTKKALTILLTTVLFLSIVLLGGSTVFRVGEFAINATVVSEEAKLEATQLKEDLTEFYKEKSIFSVKKEDVFEMIEKYPSFQVITFKKCYPDKVLIEIEEQAEVYAVAKPTGGYYILGGNGVILAERDSYENRLDKAENVLLNDVTVSGETGGFLGGDSLWDSMFALCSAMDEAVGGIRSNIVSVQVVWKAPETIYLITTREGVKIYVYNPAVMTKEKAVKAMNEYMGLPNEKRMAGSFIVYDMDNKVIVGNWVEEDLES